VSKQLVDRLLQAFSLEYDVDPMILARSPGRVNLIGEHTDYNDGFVLPVAIDRAIYVVASRRTDRLVRLFALDYADRSSFFLNHIRFDRVHQWSNYARGVASVLQRRGYALCGIDACIAGDVPIGAGLSSSAALEVAMAITWRALAGLDLSDRELALSAQQAENDFVGMRCGIMDQFIAVFGRKGHALLLDCRSLAHELVPLPPGCAIVVANTMKQRGLVDSEYNKRRAECEKGLRLLQRYIPEARALRDIAFADLERHKGELPEVVYRRCRHVVTENERVLEAARALREGDARRFGELMVASHRSLKDDYEVSCPELDIMVEVALSLPGAYGSRMTGAGFGGCTVSLVEEAAAEAFAAELALGYSRRTGIIPEVYICSAANGATLHGVDEFLANNSKR
jgi:galactokinase